MTRLPDISNLKINNAGAMDALAKGEEMTCIHDWDFTPDNDLAMFVCLKCGEKLDVVDAMNRLNMLEDDAARLRKEGDEYRAQLAARNALVDRLVEAGEDRDGILIHSHGYSSAMYVWQKIVAEYRASKDGGGE